jgi:hypothetical protein
MSTRDPRDYLPDIGDGLTHRERIVLQCLYDLQQELGGGMFLRACCTGLWLSMWT